MSYYPELEAAMCAWEHMLTKDDFDEYGGAGQLRYCCAQLAREINHAWAITIASNEGEYLHGCYDWDFVPWFLDNCVIWENCEAILAPDWVQQCQEHGRPELSDEELLLECRSAFNQIPNTPVGSTTTYSIAAKIDVRLNQ
jgi:hypothetical protein